MNHDMLWVRWLAKINSLSPKGSKLRTVRALIGNELVISGLVKKEMGVLCYLTLTSPKHMIDCVSWNFLMVVVNKMGFGSRWCEWILFVPLFQF